MGLLIALFCGGLGGNMAAGIYRAMGLGFVLNSAAGILGGGAGWYALDRAGPEALIGLLGGGIEAAFAAPALAGAVGGFVALMIVGSARRAIGT